MARGPDEDTEKLPVPPMTFGAPNVIPLQPSIREEFLGHRKQVAESLDEVVKQMRVQSALFEHALATQPVSKPSTVGQRLVNGAAIGGKFGGVVLAVLGLAQAVAKMVKPEWSGPIDNLVALFGGG